MDKPYWLPDKAYQVMKWLGLVAVNAAVVCVSAVGTFVGSLIGVSAAKAYFANQE